MSKISRAHEEIQGKIVRQKIYPNAQLLNNMILFLLLLTITLLLIFFNTMPAFSSLIFNVTESTPRLIIFNNRTNLLSYALEGYWNDTRENCLSKFTCVNDLSEGYNDSDSLRLSTVQVLNNTWSWIDGRGIDLPPGEQIKLVTHMKTNSYAKSSHISFEHFHPENKSWGLLLQCPAGNIGINEWSSFSCEFNNPSDNEVLKIRPVLNAGWSSFSTREAVTWFDDIYMFLVDQKQEFHLPTVRDANLKIENISSGHKLLSSLAFLGPDDFIVTEKYTGKVTRIKNGTTFNMLDLNVANDAERGLLGIAVGSRGQNETYVFLYFTEMKDMDRKGTEQTILGNHLYRYELDENKSRLINPKPLLNLSAFPGPYHNGGVYHCRAR